MALAQDIRRLGFRRWYEGQLVLSHVYLAAAFLGLIVLLSGVEMLDLTQRSPQYFAVVIVVAAGAGTAMLISWRRFNVLLARAEQFAAAAECPVCRTWGKFSVLAAESESDDDPPEAGRPHWVRVRCSKCGADWKLG